MPTGDPHARNTDSKPLLAPNPHPSFAEEQPFHLGAITTAAELVPNLRVVVFFDDQPWQVVTLLTGAYERVTPRSGECKADTRYIAVDILLANGVETARPLSSWGIEACAGDWGWSARSYITRATFIDPVIHAALFVA